jgi:hypothetical protein
MTASRPYRKKPLSHEIAVAELEKYAGIQFDPEIVPVLVNLDREILDPTPAELGVLNSEELGTGAESASPQHRARMLTGPEEGEGQTGTRRTLASDDVS